MAQRGRPRKPDVMKELEGNPGKRVLNDCALEASGSPAPPSHVKGYAKKVWDAIIASMPPRLYAACDSQLLAAYCVASEIHHQATLAIKKEGAISTGESGAPYQSPWVSILNREAQLLATLGSRLGLDPAARSSLNVPKGTEKKSKFAELIPIRGGQKSG